ncbi:uroporphyrinogen-III synthase [Sphingomonas sp. CFBP 8760]|uniref:uroporphyrinogen-III synthase n=1 Tax=Sphingomonas sp. CFBP 8760 TaxID=2775282 RepID=UPI00177A8874|nr:uroporphyrinogen-III synthase [Sphingomonas sp. CFBP 8760]
MNRAVAVLRPEPGNARTAALIAARGGRAIRLPLFAVAATTWTPPDPAGFDALVATSANAFRHGGDGLARLRTLPVWAVGRATAYAAADAGFAVEVIGARGVESLVAAMPAGRRLLHLAGRERIAIPDAVAITVYAAEPLPVAPDALAALAGGVALLHSARAGARLAALVDRRGDIELIAISGAVAAAAGGGWASVTVAARPDDATLVALALGAARNGNTGRPRE